MPRAKKEPDEAAHRRLVRARLEIKRELQTRRQQQAAVTSFGMSVLSGADLHQLLDAAVVLVAETLGVEYAKVLQLLPEGRALCLQAGIGWREGLVGQATVDAGTHSQAGYTLISDGPVIVEDLRTETRFSGPALLVEHEVVSGMSVIIQSREHPFGVLGAHTTRRRTFTQDDIHFLQAVANALAMAIERGRAEEELRVSEARKGAILDTAPDCIISMNHTGQIVEFNPAAEQTFGYSREDVLGKPLAELIIPPSLRGAHARGLAHYLATGEGPVLDRRLEVSALRADGTLFPAELTITRIPTDGPPVFTGFIRDITAWKQAEAEREQLVREQAARTAAEAAERRLANILESLTDAFVAFDFDWRYTYVNASAERLLGKPRQELLGRVVWDVFPQAVGTPNYRALQRAMAERVSVVTEAVSSLIGGWTELRAYPAEDGLVVYVQDITERKQAEAVRAHLATIVAASADAIIGTTLEGVITSWNPGAERLYGYTAEELVGRPISLVIPPERPDELPAILERLKRGERIAHYETVRLRKDAERLDVSLSISPIRDNAGQFIGAATIARDITERKRLEKALREEETLRRRQQEFAALVELSPDLIIQFDRALRHVYVNAAVEQTTGLPAEALIGKSIRDLRNPEETLTTWERALRHVFATGREQTIEFAFPAPAGVRHFQTRLVPEFAEDGSVATVLSVSRDITARKQAEDERERLYRDLHDVIGRLLFDRDVEARRQQRAEQLEPLTRRERDILRLLAQGWTNRQIGEHLNLSAGTVKNYVTRLLPKLGAATRAQAAALAVELGLLDRATK